MDVATYSPDNENTAMRFTFIALLVLCIATAQAQSKAEVVCTYAPSQSKAVAAISGAAGGAGATVSAVTAATGLTAVAHSSSAMILTGSSGYIAGTIGGAAVAPFIVGVGILVGGTAVTLELLCAPKNHPEQVKQIESAATEFSRRFADAMNKTIVATGELKRNITPVADKAAVQVKRIRDDVIKYAYKASGDAKDLLSKK